MWCSERSRGGVSVERDLDGGWIFPYKWAQCKGAKDSSRIVWDRLWQKAVAQLFIRLCRSMLDTDPSAWTSWLWRWAQKAEAKVRSNDSFFPKLSTLYDRRRSVKIFTMLSVKLGQNQRPLSLILNSLQPWRVSVPAEMPCAPFFVERLWKDPLCVPLELLFLQSQPCASVLSDRGTSITWPPWSLWARLGFQAWCLRAASL